MNLRNNLKVIILAIAVVTTLISIYLALIYTPSHDTMGDTQRIFYFHVSSAWVSYLAFAVTFFASILYLKSKNLKWDMIAVSSAEIGIIFCTLAIITGSLWAKSIWGIFWRWEDIKLFITLVLWLVFIAYLALRANVTSHKRKASLSAVFAIIGFICVPLSFAANRIWQQYHPTVLVSSGGSLQASMAFALFFTVFAFTFLYLYLLIAKIDIGKMQEKIEQIKQQIGG